MCPECGSFKLIVSDSRPSGDYIRRRRTCLICGLRFTTMEVLARTVETPVGRISVPVKYEENPLYRELIESIHQLTTPGFSNGKGRQDGSTFTNAQRP